MTNAINAILVIILVLNIFSLGTSRILAVIHAVAAQGILLGLLPLLVHGHLSPPVALVAAATVILKGALIPGIMTRALREAQIKREMEPLIGLLPSLILGALATAGALLFANRLPLASGHGQTLLVPAAIATILVGFILLTTRFKAISQAIGYLVLENGIFIFGMLLAEAMPLVVEMGMLLDLFVGIFVTCIIVNHINRAFASMDTRHLVTLKE
ncbi:MAG: hydrogenase [Lentisphaeria bacterium]|jgi:hydrogenase-4 component E